MSRSTSPNRPRRADAERNIAAILDAALEALADDLDASMADIAGRAGVVRATLYAHFPTRDALIEAVTDRAISDATALIESAEPDRGDAVAALRRVVSSAWRALDRYHALVALNTQRPAAELHRRHRPVLALLKPLIERGQTDGSFRGDVPPEWHLSMILALVHAASTERRAARIDEDAVEHALVASVVVAVSH